MSNDNITNYTPNAKAHFYISLVKSGFRIAAGLVICGNHLVAGGVFIIVAELLGIVEELV